MATTNSKAAAVLLLVLCVCAALPSRLLAAAAGADSTSRRALRQAPAPQLTQRVVFDPNRGENNKAEDYVANVYIGQLNFAEADPAAAGAGGAASAGVQLTYDRASYFDYEGPSARADVGPGAKAVGAAVARILGVATAKATGKTYGKSNLSYRRNAFTDNSASFGTVNEVGTGVSAGLFLDRAAKDDSAALQTPSTNFVFGR